MNYSQFSSFSEFTCDGEGRLYCVKTLFQKMIFLPFVLIGKATITFFRAVGLLMGTSFLIASFGASEGAREFFFRRVVFLARDLADWVLLPFVVIQIFLKLILGSIQSPAHLKKSIE